MTQRASDWMLSWVGVTLLSFLRKLSSLKTAADMVDGAVAGVESGFRMA